MLHLFLSFVHLLKLSSCSCVASKQIIAVKVLADKYGIFIKVLVGKCEEYSLTLAEHKTLWGIRRQK